VRTGKIRGFERHEIRIPHVLASACLPFIFQAVEINGEHYWDGGYTGNPAIFPLIYGYRDIVVVHINPLERDEAPRTAAEILDRVNEISFKSSLMREMRAISFVTRLLDERLVDGGRLKRVFIHSISADEVMKKLGASTKLNADWVFLAHLHACRASIRGRLDREVLRSPRRRIHDRHPVAISVTEVGYPNAAGDGAALARPRATEHPSVWARVS
jgi:NTE family protein